MSPCPSPHRTPYPSCVPTGAVDGDRRTVEGRALIRHAHMHMHLSPVFRMSPEVAVGDEVVVGPGVAGEQGHEAWVRRRRVFEEAAVLGGGNHLVTPSRRVAAGDLRALDAQLYEAMTLVSSVRDATDDALVGLALDAGWFKHSANVDELYSRLQTVPAPTAIALAAPYDPLGAEQSVHNLRYLVQRVQLALLRSDLAAVGAWAWGARFASVGLTSTVRHLPVPMRLSNPGDRTPHVLMPGVLAWVKGVPTPLRGRASFAALLVCGVRWPLAWASWR